MKYEYRTPWIRLVAFLLLVSILCVAFLYAFKDFTMNMSYPKKIVDSPIENEFLKDFPNFRYKKVIVLMGANASGKTSLGKVLLDIFNFIDKKEFTRLTDRIGNKSKKASFTMDFVDEHNFLNRVEVMIEPAEVYRSEHIHASVQKEQIRIGDNYEKCAERFQAIELISRKDYIEQLEKIDGSNWMFEFTLSPERKKQYLLSQADKYLDILKTTLITLDPRIKNVTKVKESDDSYIIKYENYSILLHDGELIDKNNVLSSGTKEGIGVANIIASVKGGDFSFVYCDEKFSHIHSETEKTFLSVMIECMGENSQLFFTTHNSDILDMNLPKHTFAFLRRSMDEENRISCIYASEYLKKNTESLRNAVENDLFASLPNDDLLYALVEI